MAASRSLFLVVITFMCCMFFHQNSSHAAESPLRVAISGPYAPFAIVGEDGTLSGFDVDIAEAICKVLERKCTIENMEFDEIIPAIVAGKVDIAVADMGPTPERRKLVDFTDRYYRSASIFIGRSGMTTDLAPEKMKGLRVGAQLSSLQHEYLVEHYSGFIQIVTDSSYDAVFEMLKKGDVDLILSDGLPGYAYLSSENGKGLESMGSPDFPVNEKGWCCITLAKNKEQLREAINNAIQTIRRNGEYDRINRKYFDFMIY